MNLRTFQRYYRVNSKFIESVMAFAHRQYLGNRFYKCDTNLKVIVFIRHQNIFLPIDLFHNICKIKCFGFGNIKLTDAWVKLTKKIRWKIYNPLTSKNTAMLDFVSSFFVLICKIEINRSNQMLAYIAWFL